MQTRGALGQQLLIPVGFHSFVVLMGLSYVRSVAFQLCTSSVRQRIWAKSSIKSEEISANGMSCPGGMSVRIRSSFCCFIGAPHRYCVLLWFLLRHGTTLRAVLALSLILSVSFCGVLRLAKIYFCMQRRRNDNSVGLLDYSLFSGYLVSEGPARI